MTSTRGQFQWDRHNTTLIRHVNSQCQQARSIRPPQYVKALNGKRIPNMQRAPINGDSRARFGFLQKSCDESGNLCARKTYRLSFTAVGSKSESNALPIFFRPDFHFIRAKDAHGLRSFPLFNGNSSCSSGSRLYPFLSCFVGQPFALDALQRDFGAGARRQ